VRRAPRTHSISWRRLRRLGNRIDGREEEMRDGVWRAAGVSGVSDHAAGDPVEGQAEAAYLIYERRV